MYETAKTLQGIIGFKFEFPPEEDSDRPRKALDLPEMQLAVLLIISTKLLFPFDDIKRYPATHREPSTQIMDWSAWIWAQRRFEWHPQADGKLGKELAIQVTDKDVCHMDLHDMDNYMDWYEKHWLEKPKGLNPVADMFPTGRPEPEARPETEMSIDATASDPQEALKALLQRVMGSLEPAQVSSARQADLVRPGSWYRRYRWESQLPDAAHAFYKLVAYLASVSMTSLVRSVVTAEWRISKSLEDERRAEYLEQWNPEGEEGEEGNEDDDEVDEVDKLDEQLYNLGVGEGLSL